MKLMEGTDVRQGDDSEKKILGCSPVHAQLSVNSDHSHL
jgi:hypothetical protein